MLSRNIIELFWEEMIYDEMYQNQLEGIEIDKITKFIWCTRDGLHKIEARYWRYFRIYSHNLGPIKELAPRIVNLNIDEFNMGFDGRL